MGDLGIFIDADLSMRSHVQRTVAGCFAALPQLRSVQQSVPSSVFQTLIVSLVLMKLDFGIYGRRLWSATSSQLDVCLSRLITVGDRSFASAGPKLWNSLSDDITSASSLPVFRKKLKTHLFQQSYPDIIL